MESLPILLRLMAQLWVAAAAGVIVMSLAGTFMRAGSLLTGVNRLLEIWGPFNLPDAFAYFLLVAPAIGLYALSNWVDQHS